jgi:hydrogenase 3 maturation protease
VPSIKTLLTSRLDGAKRVAVLAIGSEFRADDAAGILVGESILKRNNSRKLKVFLGGTAPENLTGEIRRFKPSHVILVDTAEMKESAGTVLLLKPEELSRDITFSTHKMPAEILIEYFIKTMGCVVTFIGIQPLTIKFGTKPSKHVKDSAREVASAILGAVRRRT